ncbi:hypothetical protein Tco_0185368 [Tanacetum coccineum]
MEVKLIRVKSNVHDYPVSVRTRYCGTSSETSKGMTRTVLMDEAHASRYLVHPRADKTYYNLGDMYWPEITLTLQNVLETRLDLSTAKHPQADGQSDTYGFRLIGKIILRAMYLSWVQETIDKVVLIKEKLKVVRDRQKSCADNRRKPLEFEVRERVMLKVSPWKGVIRFGKKGSSTEGQILQGEGSTIPVESHHTPTVAPSTSQPHHSPTLRNFIRQETKVPQPSFPTQTHVADKAASIGVDDRHGGASTTVSGLEVGQGSDRVAVLENDLKQTKKTYGVAFYQTYQKGQDFRENYQVQQSYKKSSICFTDPEEVYTAEPDISTANVPVSIAGAEVSIAAESLVYIRRSAVKRKDKGKAIMEESEPTQTKTKIQQEQERLGFEEAHRLQEQFDEEER